jgi:hypothetical protein
MSGEDREGEKGLRRILWSPWTCPRKLRGHAHSHDVRQKNAGAVRVKARESQFTTQVALRRNGHASTLISSWE